MAESHLNLTHQIDPAGVCAITCEGVLDAHTSSGLDQLIDKVVKQGVYKLICDLNQVTYIASAGVGVFVGFVNTCRENGGNLILVHPIGFDGKSATGAGLQQGFNVLEVFNLLGLADFITVAKTLAEARSQFA